MADDKPMQMIHDSSLGIRFPPVDKIDIELCSPKCDSYHTISPENGGDAPALPVLNRKSSSYVSVKYTDPCRTSYKASTANTLPSLQHMEISMEMRPVKEEELCPAFMRDPSYLKDSVGEMESPAMMKMDSNILTATSSITSKPPTEPAEALKASEQKCLFCIDSVQLQLSSEKDQQEEKKVVSTTADKEEQTEIEKDPLRKKPYTPEEDKMILKLVHLYGEKNWSKIAELMPGRNRKQLRDHYINFLKKKIDKKEFTPEEDETIVTMVKKHGHAWKRIADCLPGRAPIMIKNRYNSKLRKKRITKSASCDHSFDQLGSLSKGSSVSSYAEGSSIGFSKFRESPEMDGRDNVAYALQNVANKIRKLQLAQQ